MDNYKTSQYFSELLLKFRDDIITDDELRQLEAELRNNPQARRYYVESAIIHSLFQGRKPMHLDESSAQAKAEWDHQFWGELAAYEKTAPEVKLPEEKLQRELIQKVVYPARQKRKISKFGIFVLGMNAAAILFVVLFLKFAPAKQNVEVAALSDSINAKWADMDSSMKKGARLIANSDKLMLREGLAEITFDNHTRVVLEAPVEFQILADDRIGLTYGKLYTTVPPDAVGFSVYTLNTKIIDMGTEFGVQADFNGNTQLSVLKGKTLLVAGEADKVKMEVSAGTAKKVFGVTGEISDIGCQSDYFVRDINSESNFAWRGQKTLDLADIVGGGNGFGSGTIDMGIDLITAISSSEFTGTRESSNDYRPVPSNICIDGVFIPNGQTQQIISSQGHLFRECPATNGSCYNNITYAMRTIDLQATQNATASDSPLVHSILMHANTGITYDLQTIRTLLPDVNIVRFQSKCGIEKGAIRPSASNADFWVLVDGKVRYKKTQVKAYDLLPIDIELSEKDRFLTLITTDGQDPEGRTLDNLVLEPIDSDWGMFAEPVLVLE